MLPLPLSETFHRDARIKRCRSDAHSGTRGFHAGSCGLEVGIPLHSVRNKRGEFRVVKSENPVRHNGAGAMRPGPTSGDLRTSRFGHDVRAKGWLPEHTTGKCETRSGP